MIQPDLTRLSPNFNDAPVVGRTVIIHATRSGKSKNPTEFIGTLNHMSTKGTTSSQWVISRDGFKARVVRDNHQSWHAGVDNPRTWGIELEQGAEEDGFTAPQLEAAVDVCVGYVLDFGVPMERVMRSTEPGFIGHQDTLQGKASGKSDPGRLFPWTQFMHDLRVAVQRELSPPAEETMLGWFAASKLPEGVQFRSYLLFASRAGLSSWHVPDAASHEALSAAGQVLRTMDVAKLKAFKPTPAPDAP